MTKIADSARINAVLPAEVEAAFRAAVATRKGLKKGNLSDALTEAIQLWLADLPTVPPRPDPPKRRPGPRRSPQEAEIARMTPGERMELAYSLSEYGRSFR